MSFYLLLFLAFGLSMDAFAVSVTNGLCCKGHTPRTALSCGLAFGVAQGIMPLFGYWAGHTLGRWIEQIDHWVALVLLSVIGVKMIVEAVKNGKNPEDSAPRELALSTLIVQAFATSIDALAVGVSLGVMQVNIVTSVLVIAAVTFACCFIGVCVGQKFGALLSGKAEIAGGVILIFIGIRILVEHLFA